MVYNRATIKHILLTTYRQGRVLIGPSRAYVRAGALASTYTPIDDFAREAATLIRHWLENGVWPAPRYPEHFNIVVNRQVARSLNILVPKTDILESQLRALEAPPASEVSP